MSYVQVDEKNFDAKLQRIQLQSPMPNAVYSLVLYKYLYNAQYI